jgi:hypothetical protein
VLATLLLRVAVVVVAQIKLAAVALVDIKLPPDLR